MRAVSRKKTLERRFKELEREARDVRTDMKRLRRALQSPDRLAAAPRPRSLERRREAVSPPHRSDPASRIEELPGIEPSSPEAGADDLFAWRPPRAEGKRSSRSPEAAAPSGARPGPAPKAGRVLADERFANYFSSGSFVRPSPSPGASHVQRNKAIFMLVMVVVVGFILYRLFF